MGNCSSCLGDRRGVDAYYEDEEAPLFDDPANLQYGSFGEQNMTSQDDDMEAQREIEALQRIVAKTSDNMVDVFEFPPQGHNPRTTPAPFAYAGQEAKITRYQNLLSKISAGDANSEGEGEGADGGIYVDWSPEVVQETIEMRGPGGGKADDKPLVGTFADAAAAMG